MLFHWLDLLLVGQLIALEPAFFFLNEESHMEDVVYPGAAGIAGSGTTLWTKSSVNTLSQANRNIYLAPVLSYNTV